MDRDTRQRSQNDTKRRKRYEKPRLVVHGTVAELTQSGGVRRRDGIITRSPS